MGDYRTDVIYVTPDGDVFWSPDGVGRYFYESITDAREDTGIRSVVPTLDVWGV